MSLRSLLHPIDIQATENATLRSPQQSNREHVTSAPTQQFQLDSPAPFLKNGTEQEHDILAGARSMKFANTLSLSAVEFRVLKKFIYVSKELQNSLGISAEFIPCYPSVITL